MSPVSSVRLPWIIFWAGFLVRVVYLTFAHTYRFSPFEDHFTYGYEMARIARALVTGYGYADPFNGHTGPTAWIPPIYPLVIAAVFKLTGVYTATSAWILLTLNSLFSAATSLCVYEIATRCFNRRVALWSAWIWALYPATMQYAVRWIWETSLSSFLFAATIVLALRMRRIGEVSEIAHDAPDGQSTRRWLLFGLLWALIALSNSTLLLFLPVCGIWILLGARNQNPESISSAISRAALAVVVFLACIAPWVWRNARVFDAFIPMRSNFGAELYAGNGPGSYGFRYGVLIGLPAQDAQHRLYVQLGEIAYVKQRGQLARDYIHSHPKHFAALTLKRFYFFWASVPHPTEKHPYLDYVRQINYCLPSITGLLGLALSLKRRVPAAGLFAWAFVLLPLTYYFVTVEARFRHPLEPLIVILSVYLFQSAMPRRSGLLSIQSNGSLSALSSHVSISKPASLHSSQTLASQFRPPWLIFWIGFLVRVLVITLGHTYRIRLFQDHFQFGWEMGRIARALATGYGFADPFVGHTGPTAWVSPLYPLLIAAVFKLAGVYTATSAWIILTINSVFSAATALAVYEIAARCYNRKVATWSAWLWALYPAALQYAIHWVWEMSLTTMLFAGTLVLALRMRGIGEAPAETGDRQSTRRWLIFAVLWALIALSNPSLLLFLPICGICVLLGAPRKTAAASRAVLAGILFLACIAPWIWRNWMVMHAFIPMRSNLPAEFYAGSGPGSNGFAFTATLPLVERDPETLQYKALGEVAFVRKQGEMAKAYISSHRAHYARISFKRFYFYWVSVPHPIERSWWVEFIRELDYCFLSITGCLGLFLSLRNRIPAAGLFAWAFVLLPLIYYFVTVQARFRHPLEPLITIFTVYLFQSAGPRRKAAAPGL